MGFDIGGLVGGLVGGSIGKAIGAGLDDVLGIKPEGGGATGDILKDVLHAFEGDSESASAGKGDTAGSTSDTVAGLAKGVKAGGGSEESFGDIAKSFVHKVEHKAEDWLDHLLDGATGSKSGGAAPAGTVEV